MRAVLYARVSTRGQQEGYSLDQQFDALREHCQQHGIEVAAEVYDVYTGYSLERPGLGEMLDLVRDDPTINLVLAQDRDRFGRDDVVSVIKYEFAKRGVKLRAFNDPDEEDPYGKFVATVMDGTAALERAVTTVRTMRGRKQRAREGKVIGSCPPPYGYRYNEDRTNFDVDPLTMPTARRIFEMVAAGSSINGICTTFDAEGIPTIGNHRKKGERWYPNTIRRIIFNDAYKGVWTYGERRIKMTPMGAHKRSVEAGEDPITVPIPHSGIPDELIDTARENINDNYKPRPTSSRFFELARLLHCGECGNRMTHYNSGQYSYYVCRLRRHEKTCDGPSYNASKLEARVMKHADKMLRDPERLQRHFDEAIESVPTTFSDSAPWIQQLQECDRKRARLQDMYLNDRLTDAELDRRLAELDSVKAAAQDQLDAARDSESRIQQLESDRRTLLQAFGDGMDRGLAEFTPEGRRAIYDALSLRISVSSDGVLVFNARWNENVMRTVGLDSNFSLEVPLSG